MRTTTTIAVGLLCATGCFAQRWELGATGGYGFYRDASVIAPAGTATAGIRDRFVLGAVASHHMYEHVSGEIRYTYQDGDPFVELGPVQANVQGQSHAIHYDLLFQFRPREARVRPYIVAGIGAKRYMVTGPEVVLQPLGEIAVLTRTAEWQRLVTPGAGISIRTARNVVVRLDFRDYITPFPSGIIAPAQGGTARGIFHQFTPMVGVGYAF